MNGANTNRGIGRLTGRTEMDAGIFRYREMLAQAQEAARCPKGSVLTRILRATPSIQRHRRAATVVGAALLLTLVLSLGSAAQMSAGCLWLTVGSGGGPFVAAMEPGPEVIIAESSGSYELTATGEAVAGRVARYDGEPCCGPYVFAP